MLRKLVAPIAVVGMLFMLASSVNAGELRPLTSRLKVNLGALPPIVIAGTYQHGGWATVVNNGTVHDLTEQASIFNQSGVAVGTALLTGVSYISKLTLTAANLSGTEAAGFSAVNPIGGALGSPASTPYSGTLCPGGCLGGTAGMTGQFIITLLGTPAPFPLSVVGVGGTATLPFGQGAIQATGAPWITGKARITNITTNVISLPTRGTGVTGIGVTLEPNGTEEVRTFTTAGGFKTTNPTGVLETAATVTLGGTNNLASASLSGAVTLISPLRIQTGPLGVGQIPGKFQKTFTFAAAPEPGTVLLLVSGAAGLVFIGRKRMKS